MKSRATPVEGSCSLGDYIHDYLGCGNCQVNGIPVTYYRKDGSEQKVSVFKTEERGRVAIQLHGQKKSHRFHLMRVKQTVDRMLDAFGVNQREAMELVSTIRKLVIDKRQRGRKSTKKTQAVSITTSTIDMKQPVTGDDNNDDKFDTLDVPNDNMIQFGEIPIELLDLESDDFNAQSGLLDLDGLLTDTSSLSSYESDFDSVINCTYESSQPNTITL